MGAGKGGRGPACFRVALLACLLAQAAAQVDPATCDAVGPRVMCGEAAPVLLPKLPLGSRPPAVAGPALRRLSLPPLQPGAAWVSP